MIDVVRHVSAVLVFLIAIGASAARSDGYFDLPLDDDLRDEIRTILDAGNGQIRRWDRPPTVVIIYRDDRAPGYVSEAIEIIESGRVNFIGYGPVTAFDLDSAASDIFGQIDLVPDDGDLLLTLTGDDEVLHIRGDIFVFALELDELLLFGALTRLNTNFMRQIARSQRASCFYSAWSRNDHLAFAGVYIPISYPEALVRGCMYEELIQSMGLLNDSVGSQTFTLNNLLIKPESNAADLALLDALYAPEIETGTSVDEVIRYVEDQFEAE
ncbi:DUF2927 domain-containing protein [Jannaschia sp. CCS1]|uniref:DUF2927 domain-containing protein n=1 Tax=Jannaschia sp. (strain CCS1) TaxID=290400 RepID=UPI000053CD5E|nr:DUF2927 domain-containing protein [Jannaschia sp. CCS1]ABD54452.1 hypothetical protein Jann_1535 [Jannaschia sp. CCS1]